MSKIFPCFFAALLSAASLSAFAQDSGVRSDGFDQPMPRANSSAQEPAAPPRRVSITNAQQDGDASGDYAERTRASEQERDAVDSTPRARRQDFAGRSADAPPSEFQKFLFDSTGKILPVFGNEFFSKSQNSFSPIAGSPVPADYPLGAGDQLTIRGWGTIDIDLRATIDRNGMISIPTVGSVVLAGVRAGDAESVIRSAVARLYKGVTISVNFGKLRAITVYVVGQAKRPGTYTVSSLSTLVTTLFASGGPNANGSMRQLQVKRSGRVVAELDLYAFIAKGDKSADIKLQDGDTIFIPSAKGYVALLGKVNKPAIFELRGANDTVASLLDYAGGLPVVADPRRAFLERIDANKSQPRSVEQFALDADGLKRSLKNGDVLNITSITPDFSNAVVLRGNVDQAIRAPFKAGMRVSTLIPNREYLITRRSIKRQNSAMSAVDRDDRFDGRNESLTGAYERDQRTGRDTPSGLRNRERGSGVYRENGEGGIERADAEYDNAADGRDVESIAARIGGLIEEINWDYAVVERVNRTDLSVSLIPFNLGKVFSNPGGPDDILLQPGDTVTIFSQKDVAVPMDRRRVFVRVEGEVVTPGVYQMKAGETLQTLLARAGGITPDAYIFGSAFYREQVRQEQQINLDKAALRLETQLRSEQSRSVANTRTITAIDAQVAEAQRQAEMAIAEQNIARFKQLKPTGRIAFGLDPAERSVTRLPQLKLENGDRLVIPARPDFVHIFGAVNAEASPLWRQNARVDDYIKKAGMTVDADRDNIFIMRIDGTVLTRNTGGWGFGGIGGVLVMPGDAIVVPEKFDKETGWSKFTKGTREWAQIFANFGLGAAALKVLKD